MKKLFAVVCLLPGMLAIALPVRAAPVKTQPIEWRTPGRCVVIETTDPVTGKVRHQLKCERPARERAGQGARK